jgi:hypothetical protein
MTARSSHDRPSDVVALSKATRDRHAEVLEALEKAIAATRPLAADPASAQPEAEAPALQPQEPPSSPEQPRWAPPSHGHAQGLHVEQLPGSTPHRERAVDGPAFWEASRSERTAAAPARLVRAPEERTPPRSPYAPRPPHERPRRERPLDARPSETRNTGEWPAHRPARRAVEPDWSMRTLFESEPRAPRPVDLDTPQGREDIVELLRMRQRPQAAAPFAPPRPEASRSQRHSPAVLVRLALAAAAAALAAYLLVQFVTAHSARQASSGTPGSIAQLAGLFGAALSDPSGSVRQPAVTDGRAAGESLAPAAAANPPPLDPLVPKPVRTTAVVADGPSAAPQRVPEFDMGAAPTAEPAPAGAVAAGQGDAPRDPAPLRRLAREEVLNLVTRGVGALQNGDVAAARLLLRRAAEAGDAQAAMALGASYDPSVLKEIGALGALGDVAEARAWYRRSSEMGSTEAARRLQMLARQTP